MENNIRDVPVCVDLDGTLLRTDSLLESLLNLLQLRPWLIWVVPFWLLKGRLFFKFKLIEWGLPDVSTLPWNGEFLDWLKRQRHMGRSLVLATAAPQPLAQAVADHLQIFDAVFASTATNLKGQAKADVLVAHFGVAQFDYAGNSKEDFPVWQQARTAIAVQTTSGIQQRLGEQCSAVFPGSPLSAQRILHALRIHQWVKNLLVFLPLLLAHHFYSGALWLQIIEAFLTFSFCASSVYLLNDLLDLRSDRLHATKRHRPFASGQLALGWGLIGAPCLFMLAFVMACLLAKNFLWVLLLYYLITLAYSFYLKSKILVDVLALAILYTCRLLAGAAACQIALSFWLLTFSLFFFFSLALVKRYSELLVQQRMHQLKAHGRSYHVEDLVMLLVFGVASGLMAVLVMALYINSPVVVRFYRQPQVLWLIVPVLMYWISRIWVLAHRDQMHEDPVLFAVRDRVSWVVLLLLGCTFVLAL